MSRTNDSARLRSATPRQRTVIVVALIAIPVLLLALVVSRLEATGHVVEAGDGIEMTEGVHSGTMHAVRLPTSTVAVSVGDPVEEVDESVVDLPTSTEDHTDPDAPVRPEDGHLLLPVTWGLEVDSSSVGAEDTDGLTPADEDATPVDIALVVDDEEHDLVDERQVQSVINDGRESLLVPVPEETEAADITVEVTYDGLTQTLSPESGDIEAGAAEPLYDTAEMPVFDTSCASYVCRLRADRDSEWQLPPDDAEAEPGQLHLSPHHPELGWADEGKSWAWVNVRLLGPTSFYNEDDDFRFIESLPTLGGTLDGVRAKDVTRNRESRDADVRLTFPVSAGATPKKLKLTQRNMLEGSERPRTVTLHEEIEIDDRR